MNSVTAYGRVRKPISQFCVQKSQESLRRFNEICSLLREGSTSEDICKRFGISSSRFNSILRKRGTTKDAIISNAPPQKDTKDICSMSGQASMIGLTPQQHDNLLNGRVRKPRSMLSEQKSQESLKRFTEICSLLGDGFTSEYICEKLGISSSHLKNIISKRGTTKQAIISNAPHQKDTGDICSISWQASMVGLTIEQHDNLLCRIGSKRFDALKRIIISYGKKRGKVGFMLNAQLFQLSALELFDFCVSEGKKLYPGMSDLETFDAIIFSKPRHKIIRKNPMLIFTLDNIRLVQGNES